MKTGILATLLFISAASLLLEVNCDDGDQMCPHEYFKNHPENFHKTMQMMKENRYFIDFSKLPSCSENESCPENRICCQSPCGMKCMRPITEQNAEETLKLIHKDLKSEESLEPYVETEEDKKLGMCPDNYFKTHPEFQEKIHNHWKNKHQQHHHGGQCEHGKDCPKEHSKKFGKHLNHFSSRTDCNMDGDCSDQMRCCKTICGMKCMKPVFTEEDFKKSMFGDIKKHRQERDLEMEEDEQDLDDSLCTLAEHDMDHEEGENKRSHEADAEGGDEHDNDHENGTDDGSDENDNQAKEIKHLIAKRFAKMQRNNEGGNQFKQGSGQHETNGEDKKNRRGKGKGKKNNKECKEKGKEKGKGNGKGKGKCKGKGKGKEE